jgi:hypothetical protein
MSKRLSWFLCLSLILVSNLLLCSCTNSQPSTSNSSTPSPAVVQVSPKVEPTIVATQPTLPEAQNAVKRIYQEVVVTDGSHPDRFVVGDFNGDGSQDLAIVVKPKAGMTAEINSEFANWITEDPRKVVLPNPNKSVQALPASEQAKVEESDTLLAIIHGYQQSGWRNPEARQSYLLKNGAADTMEVLPLRQFPPALRMMKQGIRSRADVIKENSKGVAGFLFWTNGKYAWSAY